MDQDRFTEFMTEGLENARVEVAKNGKDLELRVRVIPDLVAFALKCSRLGIGEIKIEPDEETLPASIVVVFPDAAEARPPVELNLTPREVQVMELLATGKRNREIADELEVSIKTIDTHRGHILKKLGLRNNAELARFAVRNGVVSLS